MVTKLLTTINDREILDGQIDTFVDVSGAADRYLVEGTISGDVEVQDFDGGVIVLPAGLTLEDVQVAAGGSAVQITVNGSTITYTSGGAGAAFTVVLGGSNENLAIGQTVTAEAFADLFDAAGAGAVVGADGTLGDGTVDPGPSEDLRLTTDQDNIVGTAGDDTFTAPIVQNQLGAVTNTFESGDRLDGGAGRNVLEADLTATVSGTIPVGPAVSASTVNIQEVYLRFQSFQLDFNNNNVLGANIDAQRMIGVEQWWSEDSRSSIVIEDIRSNPLNTTFGFRNADPGSVVGGVDYEAYFSPEALEGFVDEVDSALTIDLFDVDQPALELQRIDVLSLTIEFNGDEYVLASPAIEDADTYADLAAAIQAELDADPALANLNVTLDNNLGRTVVLITDPAGGEFGAGSAVEFQNNTGGLVAQGVTPGAPVPLVELITTNIVLDNVGRGSEAGDMIVGSMSTRGGVEVFDVTVDRDSWLQSLSSTNNVLEEVYVQSAAGSDGYLFLGAGEETQNNLTNQRIPVTTDNRLAPTGVVDVRVFDSTMFAGDLKLGATLSDQIFDKYLTDAEDVIEFQYLFGNGSNNFNLNLAEDIARDRDFALSIVGGDSDDRINFTDANDTKSTISVDGGLGENVVEVQTSTNDDDTATGTTQAFAEFLNVQTLVVAGNNNTVQNIVTGNMDNAGLETILVATENGSDTTIERMLIDTELVITGKNETVGEGNNNDDQDFGTVAINGTRALPGDTELEITLQNTARLDGVLTVNELSVGDESPAFTSGVASVVLASNGNRDTSNRVTNFNAERVGDLSFVGTQDLGIVVTELGTLPLPGGLDVLVDGSALEGDLTLGVIAGGVLGGTDADELIGTAGDSDFLALAGMGAVLETTVSGFETLQFGWLVGPNQMTVDTGAGAQAFANGSYDATNTSGITNYIVGNLTGGNTFNLEGLRNGDTVTLGDATGPDGQLLGAVPQTFTLEGPGSVGAVLNIAALDVLDDLNYAAGIAEFNVSGFGTVNADLARPDNSGPGVVNYNIPFVGDNAELVVDGVGFTFDVGILVADALLVDNILQNLVLTGGSAAAGDDDVLTFTQPLAASLNVIDLSGFNGSVTFTLDDAVQQDPTGAPGDVIRANDDVRVLVQDQDDLNATLTDANAALVDFNTIFEFTGAPALQDGGLPAATWTIPNFVTEAEAGATLDNHSILDLSALGITSYAELDRVDMGGNLVLTSEAQGLNPTWQIVLNGVVEADLGIAENFIFA